MRTYESHSRFKEKEIQSDPKMKWKYTLYRPEMSRETCSGRDFRAIHRTDRASRNFAALPRRAHCEYTPSKNRRPPRAPKLTSSSRWEGSVNRGRQGKLWQIYTYVQLAYTFSFCLSIPRPRVFSCFSHLSYPLFPSTFRRSVTPAAPVRIVVVRPRPSPGHRWCAEGHSCIHGRHVRIHHWSNYWRKRDTGCLSSVSKYFISNGHSRLHLRLHIGYSHTPVASQAA